MLFDWLTGREASDVGSALQYVAIRTGEVDHLAGIIALNRSIQRIFHGWNRRTLDSYSMQQIKLIIKCRLSASLYFFRSSSFCWLLLTTIVMLLEWPRGVAHVNWPSSLAWA